MKPCQFLIMSLFAVAAGLAPLPSSAQDYDRPPAGYGDPAPDYGDQGYSGGRGYGGGGGQAEDAGAVSIRVGKLENRIREMTGQIEELQNANRKLIEQLQKFQADVDSRFSSSGARAKRSEAPPPSAGAAIAEPSAAVSSDGGATPRVGSGGGGKKGRNDAFDPDSAAANDPGKPKPLGSASSGQPDDNGSAPMDLSGGRLRRADQNSDTLAPTLHLPSTPPKTAGGTTSANGTVVASINPASPRAEFDAALGLYKEKQYEDAERGFSAFIQKNPKSRLVVDATYFLGESYAQRGRSSEAAEQYLKISKDYSNSTRAPDAMLHLGMSLKALGAKEQACATFSEVSRKYPNAPAYVKSGAEREAKRAQC